MPGGRGGVSTKEIEMADVDGTWDCTVKSPLGDQKMTVTIKSDGNAFTGSASGAMGAMDISGDVDGNTVAWKQQVSVPMPMTLDCTATAEGDTLTGSVGAGAFGSFPLSGTRTGWA
jgi:hypothetical protein